VPINSIKNCTIQLIQAIIFTKFHKGYHGQLIKQSQIMVRGWQSID
jgi:hypothetical protein